MTENNNLWYLNAFFYEVHVRAYCDSTGDGKGDIKGLISKLDYIKSLGVDCIWILPIYPSPLKDDGYDIADYYGVHPDYGTLDDFKELVKQAHQRKLKIIADIVLNHTSDQHRWFQESRSSKSSPYRDYYVWSETDKKYTDARIIFLDTEESNWSYNEESGMYYWHRFYASQPDLNYENPAVRQEMKNVMKFWLDMGIDGFRADAVPYLIEREGTNCENLPETHAILKDFRAFLDRNYEGKILLAEANQWPEDVRPYFGDGDEFHMGFHFPLMPRVYMALRKGDASPIHWIMDQTPDIPDNTQWCTFLRNHDELTLEMVTEKERQWMWSVYAPDTRMRLNLGIRRRLAPLLENDHLKILLANAIIFALPGAPIIYYGDEIGMGDNIWLFDRNGVRTPMQWNANKNAGFSDANHDNLYAPVIDTDGFSFRTINVETESQDPASLLNKMRHLINLRKSNPIFAVGTYEFLAKEQPNYLVILRSLQGKNILCVNNLSDTESSVNLNLINFTGKRLKALNKNYEDIKITEQDSKFDLSPFEFIWFQIID